MYKMYIHMMILKHQPLQVIFQEHNAQLCQSPKTIHAVSTWFKKKKENPLGENSTVKT